VLGDVSPNVRNMAVPGNMAGKPMMGSPLKRSFTAAMNEGNGFTYFKKRKSTNDTPLSQSYAPDEKQMDVRGENVTHLEQDFEDAVSLLLAV
jgi:hypothetical protein